MNPQPAPSKPRRIQMNRDRTYMVVNNRTKVPVNSERGRRILSKKGGGRKSTRRRDKRKK